jgi:phenylpyruvate tautomerase PptA (4-oxalocrotonate tautomerase family)
VLLLTKQQKLLLAAKCTEALVETINTAASV